MRLWTLHPRYLDRQGLVAVWREGLLAQAVLRGHTKGYKHHPQLYRFKIHPEPLSAIASYLYEVREEANQRGYRFNASKIGPGHHPQPQMIQTTSGQIDFEMKHLRNKLAKRSKEDFERVSVVQNIEPHPLFQIMPGEIEDWEKGEY